MLNYKLKNYKNKKSVFTILLLASCILFLSACENFVNPRPMGLRQILRDIEANPGYSEEYKKGFKEGCDSGTAAHGNYYYKTFYQYTHTPELMDNRDYARAWPDAFHICRSYMNRYLSDGNWWSEGFKGNAGSVFEGGSLRMRQNVEGTSWPFLGEMKASPWLPIFDGATTPGWGSMKWGGNMGDNNPGRLIFLDP